MRAFIAFCKYVKLSLLRGTLQIKRGNLEKIRIYDGSHGLGDLKDFPL
jgi:hypothetical protein